MDAEFFDVVKSEKANAIARFNRFRRMRQVLELVLVLGLFSWSSARAPAAFRIAAACVVEVSAYLFNHHVVFLIGNFIIVLLFVLCRRTEIVAGTSSPTTDFYDDYVKHSEAAAATVRDPPQTIVAAVEEEEVKEEEEKQIVVCKEVEKREDDRQCDDVSEAIEKATKQIRKFQRTQSEKLRREITTTTKAELRRSETQTRWKEVAVSSNLERLSSEEFRQTIEEFIDANWCRKSGRKMEEEKGNNRQLLKMY